MAVEFKLPDLGENVESVDVVSVLVNEGDTLEKDQPVFEAETDKAVVEVPSTVSGVVTQIRIKKGDTLKAGQVVLTVEESGEDKEEKPARKDAKKEPEKKEPEEKNVEKDDKEDKDDKKDKEDKNEKRPEERDRIASAPDAPATDIKGAPSAPAGERPPVAAAPTVRQFAREIGVEIHLVPGTGEGGRISIDDVKKYARERGIPSGAAAGYAEGGPPTTTESLSKLRKVAASRLSKAWQEIPHVTLHDKADVTDLENFRAQYKKKAEAAGGKLTITPLFMKIVAAALRAHPVVNASIDMERQEVQYKKFIHLGIAVDTPRGLVVPVVRDVDRKSIIELAVELHGLSGKARDGKLTPDEMSGATFTITNLGSIGVGFFTPIINPPEVAILGVGRAAHEPVWDEDRKQFTPRLLCPLSLSFDHRLVDGADAARFLRFIVEAVNNPMMLVLQ
jgi:pyruvate dehydrogenase E2 component (dihydrolipoamide acetyltransferase)